MINDTIDDPVYAGRVLEAAHGPGAASHLPESSLNSISGTNFTPVSPGAAQEGE